MANKKIKIEGFADFSAILREAKDLNATVTSVFGKKGVQVFETSSIDFLKKDSKVLFDLLDSGLKSLRKEAKDLEEALAAGGKTEKQQAALTSKRRENLGAIVRIEREIAGLRKATMPLMGGGETAKPTTVFGKAPAAPTTAGESQKPTIIFEKSSVDGLQKIVEDLKKTNGDIEESIRSATGDYAKQEKLSRQRLLNTTRIARLEKDILQYQKANPTPNVPEIIPPKTLPAEIRAPKGVARKSLRPEPRKVRTIDVVASQVGHSAAEIGHALPTGGLGNVASSAIGAGQAASAAGMSAPAIGGLALLGGAAATAALGISRMASAFDLFKQAIPNLLAISGMGSKVMTSGRAVSGAGKLGFGQLELLETQKNMERTFGRAASPHQDENRMLNTLTASRDLGMQPSDILGGADQLRQTGGTGAAQSQIAKILQTAITSGMDKTQSTHFLSAAVGLLSSLNQSGVANSAALLGTLSDLVSKGNMSPEQAAKSISGVSGAISGSEGESNAFFQSAAVRAGLGSGTLLGTNFAVRQGLLGADRGALGTQVGDTEHGKMGMQAISAMGLDDPGFSQKFASGILGEIDDRFGTKGGKGNKNQASSALGFVSDAFGVKTAGEATKVLALLEKISKGGGTSKDDRKLLESLGQDPEAGWRTSVLDKLDKSALGVSQMAAAMEKGQFDLGAASAGLIGDLNKALHELDTTMTKLLTSDAFNALRQGTKDVASEAGDTISNLATQLGKLPQIFDDAFKNPEIFGKAMGLAFTAVLSTLFDVFISKVKVLLGIADKDEDGNKKKTTLMDAVLGTLVTVASGGAIPDTALMNYLSPDDVPKTAKEATALSAPATPPGKKLNTEMPTLDDNSDPMAMLNAAKAAQRAAAQPSQNKPAAATNQPPITVNVTTPPINVGAITDAIRAGHAPRTTPAAHRTNSDTSGRLER